MLDRDLDDVANVIVGETVEDILPLPAGGDEVVGAEEAELVGDGGATLSRALAKCANCFRFVPSLFNSPPTDARPRSR